MQGPCMCVFFRAAHACVLGRLDRRSTGGRPFRKTNIRRALIESLPITNPTGNKSLASKKCKWKEDTLLIYEFQSMPLFCQEYPHFLSVLLLKKCRLKVINSEEKNEHVCQRAQQSAFHLSPPNLRSLTKRITNGVL